MTPAAAGALLGLTAASGGWTVIRRLPRRRKPTLLERVEPAVRDLPRVSRLLASTAHSPFPAAERLLRPVLEDVAGLLDRWLGGTAAVRRRCEQAGLGLTVQEFRMSQVLWSAGGVALALMVLAISLVTGVGPSVPACLSLALLLGVTGAMSRDWALTRQVTARRDAMAEELPTIAELLALAVAAGEGPTGALERVVRLSKGALGQELDKTLGQARTGDGLVAALERLAARTPLPALARFAEGMAVAVERGTPLADVLRAQAVDAREANKRALLEAGGRKELLMLAPIVFLVLPVVVLFALYPASLSFSAITR